MITKRNKYGVNPKEKRTYNGKVYASTKEMNYRKRLDLMCRAKDPKDRPVIIEEQVRYNIIVNGIKICAYVLDFRVTYADRIEAIDVKGFTGGAAYQMFKVKKALMKAVHGVEIKEV